MKFINGITVSPATVSDEKITWTVTAAGNVPTSTDLIAYTLTVQDNDNRNIDVLSQDIIEKGGKQQPKLINNEDSEASDPKVYKVEINRNDITITGSSAKVYLLVQATLNGYAKTNIISVTNDIYK